MEQFQHHPDSDVQQAIVRLCDTLCTWERNTGRTSALVIREQGGFCFRAASGKPGIPDHISDIDFIAGESGQNVGEGSQNDTICQNAEVKWMRCRCKKHDDCDGKGTYTEVKNLGLEYSYPCDDYTI